MIALDSVEGLYSYTLIPHLTLNMEMIDNYHINIANCTPNY
jgi:hypothetical protein